MKKEQKGKNEETYSYMGIRCNTESDMYNGIHIIILFEYMEKRNRGGYLKTKWKKNIYICMHIKK